MEAFGMPPELAKLLADQEAQARMTNADFHHGLDRLFAEATLEQLATLNRVFRLMARLPKGECQRMAANLEGRAMTHLELRFSICSGCGKDHDAEFMKELAETVRAAEPHQVEKGSTLKEWEQLELFKQGDKEPSATTQPRQVNKKLPSPIFQEKSAPLPDNSWMDTLPSLGQPVEESTDPGIWLTSEQKANMAAYNLDDAYEEGTNKFLGFICLGCGMNYQSIKDRSLRAPGPEGCEGCRHKAKFG